MNSKKQKHHSLLALTAMIAVLLSACASAETSPTPTAINIDAIYTAAAQTVVAGITQTARANPTATPTQTATVTATPTPISTPTRAPASIFVPVVVLSPTITGTPGPTATATLGAVGCYNATLLSQSTLPDPTKINPGDSFTQTWSVKNSGTCDWNGDFKLVFLAEPMGSDTFKIRRNVQVNGTTDFIVEMVAPKTPGTYISVWRLAADDGQMFGSTFSVAIKIAGATYTPTTVFTNTVTPSAVPATGTPTLTNAAPTATDTPTPTNTIPVPDTETPTITPTP